MTNTVLIKRSGTSSVVPSTLESGEIAINYADGKLFYKNSANSIIGAKLISNIVGTNNQISVSEASGTFTLSLPSSVYVSSLFVDNVEIDTSGATPSYVLAYNGTKFVPTAPSAGGAGAPSAYSSTIGNGSSTSYTLTHDLGTRDLVVVARNAASPYEVIDVNWQATSIDTTTIIFSSAPASNSVRVTIYAAGGTAGVTSINGTSNQLNVTQTTGSVTVSLSNNLVVPGSLSVTGSVLFGLDSLQDVAVSSATPEQFLKWNGTNWVNADIPQINALDDIGNVNVSTASSGQFLKYNGSNWINDSIPTINNLDDIGDVLAATPSTNQVLLYNGSNWIASSLAGATGSAYALTIGNGSSSTFTITHNLGTKDLFVAFREAGDDYEPLNVAWRPLDDSSIEVTFDSAPALNSVRALIYSSVSSGNGTTYTATIGNGSDTEITVTHNLGTRNIVPVCRLASSPYSDVQVSWEALADNTIKFYFGSAPSSNSIQVVIFSSISGSEVGQSVESLTNTNITSLTTGQFLKWNGSEWVNDDIPTINTLDDVGDVAISSATPGQLLKWNGSNWINSDTVENLIVSGDLMVSGTTTTINTTELLVEDNLIVLNTGSAATPSYNAGIEVERGDFANVQIRWNESTDKWQFTNDGTTYKDLGSGGVTVSDTIPVSPAQGDIWYESDTGALFAYYDSQWIEIGGTGTYNEIIGTIQAKGDLLVGDASQSLARIAVGSNNKKLSANSSTSTGLEWVDDSQNTVVDAVGDLLIGATPNLMTRLPLGSNGQILTVDSNQTYGLGWVSQNTRNLLYNGAMQVAQRATSVSSITTGDYRTADRWGSEHNLAGTYTQSIENDAPTGSGFAKSLKMTCTTAQSSLNADAYLTLFQRLEGQDLQLLKKGTSSAESVTISFWVKSNLVGNYVFSLFDFDNSREISRQYSINSTNLWEYKTITLPGDTVGSFVNDNGLSLQASFWLAAGSNRTSGTLNSNWVASTTTGRAVGQTNLSSSSSNYWQVTGLQMNVGPVAAPFEFKKYTEELAECQRYYYRIDATRGTTNSRIGTGYVVGTTAQVLVEFPVEMRSSPVHNSSTPLSNFQVYNGIAAVAVSAFAQDTSSPNNFNINIGVVSSMTTNGCALTRNTTASPCWFDFSAEL
jgi:hypothetical protein